MAVKETRVISLVYLDEAAVASMLDLRNFLELVDHTFEDGAFSKKEFVHLGQQGILAVIKTSMMVRDHYWDLMLLFQILSRRAFCQPRPISN